VNRAGLGVAVVLGIAAVCLVALAFAWGGWAGERLPAVLLLSFVESDEIRVPDPPHRRCPRLPGGVHY
jgi:hypothetical protein